MVTAEKHMKQPVCLKVMIELFEVVRIILCVHITVPGLISCNLTTSGYPCSYVYLHIDKYTTLLLKHWITILCILVYECKELEFVPCFFVKTFKSLPVWVQPYTDTVQCV